MDGNGNKNNNKYFGLKQEIIANLDRIENNFKIISKKQEEKLKKISKKLDSIDFVFF